jgi:hypothetical protein
MSRYLNELFTDTPITMWGLVLFFALFVALFCWVYLRRGAYEFYESLALMPFQEEGESNEHGR